MFRRRRLAMICLSLAIWPLLARTEDAGRPPPEVKRTVDAFLGHWTLAGTDTEPTAKGPSKLSAVIDCQSAALGMAVACHIAADVSGAGRVEASTLSATAPTSAWFAGWKSLHRASITTIEGLGSAMKSNSSRWLIRIPARKRRSISRRRATPTSLNCSRA